MKDGTVEKLEQALTMIEGFAAALKDAVESVKDEKKPIPDESIDNALGELEELEGMGDEFERSIEDIDSALNDVSSAVERARDKLSTFDRQVVAVKSALEAMRPVG